MPPVARPVNVAPVRFTPVRTAFVIVAFVRLTFVMTELVRSVPIRRTLEKLTLLKSRFLIFAPDKSAPGPTKNPPWVSAHEEGSEGCVPLIEIEPETTEVSVAFDKFVPVIVAPVRTAPALRSVTVAPELCAAPAVPYCARRTVHVVVLLPTVTSRFSLSIMMM